MADSKAPKTLAELSKVLGKEFKSGKDIGDYINSISPKAFEDMLDSLKEIYKTEKDRLDVYKSLYHYANIYSSKENEIYKIIEKQINASSRLVSQQSTWNKSLNIAERTFQKIVDHNRDIFKISHEMQLASNITWKEYRELYQGAYQAARQMNKEFGQSVVNAKDLVEVQNKLLGTGWKNINTSHLTNLSASVRMMQDTLGAFPEGLSTALQMAYRQFGAHTDQMATKLGNQLNAFSDTFGVTVGMLTGTVEKMAANNSFIARNNMQAQMMANESLIKAAALTGAIGLTSADFMTSLAHTSQFGTIEEMAGIYQGGAMLQGFDTAQFEQMMMNQNYEEATRSLFGSISGTLNNLGDDKYLRAEYMNKIGGAFGLSDTDLLQIMANGENLAEYSLDLQEKLKNLDSSMVDEIRDLKVAIPDRISNFIMSSPFSQTVGSILQEAGLYNSGNELTQIKSLVALIAYRGSALQTGVGKVKSLFSNGSTPGSLGGSPVIGMGGGLMKTAGGLAIGTMGNVIGRNMQMDLSSSNNEANFLGGLTNIGSGAAGGAMIGSVIPGIGTALGAGIGALVGLTNTIISANDRKSAIAEMEDEERRQNAAAQRPAYTGNPVVDAINRLEASVINNMNGNFAESRNVQFILDTKKKTTTGGGL
jgi:hypothetical protein